MLQLIPDLAGIAAYIACYLYAIAADMPPRHEGGPRGGHPADLQRPAFAWM